MAAVKRIDLGAVLILGLVCVAAGIALATAGSATAQTGGGSNGGNGGNSNSGRGDNGDRNGDTFIARRCGRRLAQEPRRMQIRCNGEGKIRLRSINWRSFDDPPARARGRAQIQGVGGRERVKLEAKRLSSRGRLNGNGGGNNRGSNGGGNDRVDTYRRLVVRFVGNPPEGFRKQFSEDLGRGNTDRRDRRGRRNRN